jgi:preprotein translocase subunit YajC
MLIHLVADAAPAPSVEQGLEQTLLMIVIALGFFYFILWRPEQKRRKAMDAKRSELKKGDKVIVAGGILAEVSKVQAETVILRLTDGAKMEVLKAAIQDVQPSSTPCEVEPPSSTSP